MAWALLDAGTDPNARDKGRKTPLMWAAERGAVPLLRLLVERGADPTLRDREKLTATDHARLKRKSAAAAYLAGRTDR